MKQSRSYQSYLVQLGILLLSIVLLLMTGILYHDSVSETQQLLLASAQTELKAAAYQIEREFALIHSVCEMLDTSPYVAELLMVYSDPDVSRVQLSNAHQALTDMLNANVYRCKSIRDIYVRTPARLISTQKNHQFDVFDGIVPDDEIAFRQNAQGEFCLFFKPDGLNDCAVYVELMPDVMDELLSGYENIFLYSADVGFFGAAPGKLDQQILEYVLGAQQDEAIVSGYCFARMPLTQIDNGWEIFYTSHAGEYLSAYRLTIAASALAYILSLGLALVLGYAVSRHVLRPLHRFITRVRHFKVGKSLRREVIGNNTVGLREGFFLYVTLTVSVGMMLFVVCFSLISTYIQSSHREALSQATLSALTSSLEGTFEEMHDTALRTAVDPRTVHYAKQISKEPHLAFQAALRENASVYSSKCILFLCDSKNNLLYTNSYLSDVQPSLTAIPGEWQKTIDPFGQIMLSVTIRLSESAYYLRADYDYSAITQQLMKLSDGLPSVYLADGNLEMLDGKPLPETEGGYITKPVVNTPWQVCMPYEDIALVDGVLNTLREKATLIIAMLLSAVFLSSLLSSLMLSPLARFSSSIRRVISGNFSGLNDFTRQNFAIDEISELNDCFVKMAEDIESLIDDLITSRNHMLMLENAKKNAEIDALQMQITPHFLSNTIMTIADRIQNGFSDEAKDMLYTLNKLFRYGISRRELVISVREEWAYAQAYAQIMAARKKKLSFEWYMDETALERPTIRLILQPILENAIYHGARHDDDNTVIQISCHITPQETIFSVSDNGSGLSPEVMERLLRTLSDEPPETSIGLYNVQTRIQLYCGDNYGVSAENNPDQGARFTLRLPAKL